MFEVQANAYDRFVGRYSPQLAEKLCGLAGVEPGMRALDVGAGPGALTAELARRLGAANVVAAEPSASFAQACRRRVPGTEVVEAAAESLPFADGAFDAVLSQLVLNFVPDARSACRESLRVLRRGGVLAACVWDYSGGMPLLEAFWAAAHEVAPAAAATQDEGARMRWCREGELAELWAELGLRDIRAAALRARASYDDFDDLWAPFVAGVGPAGSFCAALAPPAQEALRGALRARLGVGDEPFALTARAWAVAGTVA